MTLIYVSVNSVLLADAIDDFMQKGMIFRQYKYWMTIITKRKRVLPFLYKPLGGCFTCFMVWVYFGMFIIHDLNLFVFMLLSGIGICNFIKKTLSKYGFL